MALRSLVLGAFRDSFVSLAFSDVGNRCLRFRFLHLLATLGGIQLMHGLISTRRKTEPRLQVASAQMTLQFSWDSFLLL